jgi:hypothetical protein
MMPSLTKEINKQLNEGQGSKPKSRKSSQTIQSGIDESTHAKQLKDF